MSLGWWNPHPSTCYLIHLPHTTLTKEKPWANLSSWLSDCVWLDEGFLLFTQRFKLCACDNCSISPGGVGLSSTSWVSTPSCHCPCASVWCHLFLVLWAQCPVSDCHHSGLSPLALGSCASGACAQHAEVGHVHVLLMAGLDTEPCGAGLHCWVHESLRLDSVDMGHRVLMIHWSWTQ